MYTTKQRMEPRALKTDFEKKKPDRFAVWKLPFYQV